MLLSQAVHIHSQEKARTREFFLFLAFCVSILVSFCEELCFHLLMWHVLVPSFSILVTRNGKFTCDLCGRLSIGEEIPTKYVLERVVSSRETEE